MEKEFDFSYLEALNYHIHPYLEAELFKNGKYILALRDLYNHLVEGGIYEELYERDRAFFKDEIEYYKNYGPIEDEKNHIDCLVSFQLYAEYIINLIADTSIKKHAATLTRKKKQLVIVDDYGLEDDKLWMKEKVFFTRKIIIPTISDKFNNHQNEILETVFECIHNSKHFDLLDRIPGNIDFNIKIFALKNENKNKNKNKPFDKDMNGQNYEHYVAEIFSNFGCNARVTKISGDHGADIIATKENITIVVQCKLYSSPVGNKSVQEIYSAKGYYDGDIACVITNQNYTQAAKSAAGKLGVHLLHHDQIEDFLKEI